MKAKAVVERIKSTGCAIGALEFDTMKPATLIAYASRGRDLNKNQRDQIATALQIVSSQLRALANDIETESL